MHGRFRFRVVCVFFLGLRLSRLVDMLAALKLAAAALPIWQVLHWIMRFSLRVAVLEDNWRARAPPFFSFLFAVCFSVRAGRNSGPLSASVAKSYRRKLPSGLQRRGCTQRRFLPEAEVEGPELGSKEAYEADFHSH